MADLKELVYQTLRDDATLRTLLGNPAATPYGVYWHNLPEKPVFPIITFFINAQSGIFPRSIPFMITAWVKDDFRLILNRVHVLLHNKTVAVDDYDDVLLYYDASNPELYDDKFNVYGRQERYLATGVRKI